jgi:DNA (cytosine-5)-methyltransferase 1
MQGGWKQPMIIDDLYNNREKRIYTDTSPTLRSERVGLKCIVAMRGRNPENPTSRVAGLPTEQRLEPNLKGVSNTLTSVQKDNLVLEPQHRIRKLTPKECWRLMGFSDDDFHKAETVNSNTQLYKQAGNSIVKDVLMAIFKQMLPYEERQIDGIGKQVMVDMAVEEERDKMPF